MNEKVNKKAVCIQSVFYFCTIFALYLIISGHRKTLKALSRLSTKTKNQTNLVIPENSQSKISLCSQIKLLEVVQIVIDQN